MSSSLTARPTKLAEPHFVCVFNTASICKPNDFSNIILPKFRSAQLIKNIINLRTAPINTHLKFNYFVTYSVSCTS